MQTLNKLYPLLANLGFTLNLISAIILTFELILLDIFGFGKFLAIFLIICNIFVVTKSIQTQLKHDQI